MHLNPYGEYAVTLAADLANHPPDSTGELVDRCVDAGIVVDFPRHRRRPRDVLAMLDRWSSIADTTSDEARAEQVNLMLTKRPPTRD